MRFASKAALAVGLLCRAAQAADVSEPWVVAPPFSMAPQALLDGATKLPTPDEPAELLLEDVRVTLNDAGGEKRVYHTLYRVLNPAGVEARSRVSVTWSPWRQARPSIRARVVSADGVAHDLDASTISDAPIGDGDSDVYSDRRVAEAPLPAVAPGAIVEIEWTRTDTAPSFECGTAARFVFGDEIPVRHTRFVVSAPASLPLATVAHNLETVSPARDEKDGFVSVSYDVGPMAKFGDLADSPPYDVHQVSSVAYATCGSWSRVASGYSAIVDRQIASARVGPQVNSALKGIEGRAAKLEALVRDLHRTVRYTGVEFGESAIVPARPDETLKRRFGDCKDKSTLLVAKLRAAGFDAHVALLAAGYGPDLDLALPGMDFFDHAVVVVGGNPPVWVDTTAPYLRVGDLPPMVAGRLALIAAQGSTGLVRIPDNPAASNRIERVRDFYLAEAGPARVVDSTRPQGELEGEFREYYAGLADGDLRKGLEADARSLFKSDSLGEVNRVRSDDFSKPFSLTFEAKTSLVGESFADASVVRFPVSDFVDRLESDLPHAGRPGDSGSKGSEQPRVLPFRLKQAFVDVWKVRVHPPPGFVPGEPTHVEDVRVGPIHFDRTYQLEPDGTAVFQATLDTGDRLLWTAQELADVQAWIAKMKAGEALQIVFEQAGYKALRAGKIQDAVQEYRRLTELHPKEALHRCQLAEAYLQGGVGEAARSEARRAVALDPNSAEAWRSLGWVHINDVLARPFMKGSNLPEAERAYRKAIELDPRNELARRNLAVLLEYDPKTLERYGRNARLSDAVVTWRALRKDLDTKDYDATLLVSLARANRWTELRDFAREAQGAETRAAWLVVAIAVLSGPDEAITEAGRLTTSRAARDQLLLSAAMTCVQVRHYPAAAAFLRAGAQAAPQGAAIANAQADIFAHCRRHEELPLAGDSPDAMAKRFLLDVVTGADDAALSEYASRTAAGSAGSVVASRGVRDRVGDLRRAVSSAGLTLDGLADLALAQTESHTEGDEALGYKTRLKLEAPGQSQMLEFFMQREDGVLRLVGSTADPSALGAVALARLDAGRPEEARKWLTWARDAYPAARADLLADEPFVAFWPPDPARGDDGLRLAAAALTASGSDASKGLPILEAASPSASNEARIRIDHALRTAYWSLDRPGDAVGPAGRLHLALPDSDFAFDGLFSALLGAMRFSELEALCNERAATLQEDARLWRARARMWAHQRRWEEASKALRQVVALGKASENDYNTLAWDALFRFEIGEQAVADAERAALFGKRVDAARLHTLATVYADAGRVAEARQTLIKVLETRGVAEPEDSEWLVIGRLAEQYGAHDHALAAYRRVARPKEAWEVAGSPYELAQKWIARLGSSEPARQASSSGRKSREVPK